MAHSKRNRVLSSSPYPPELRKLLNLIHQGAGNAAVLAYEGLRPTDTPLVHVEDLEDSGLYLGNGIWLRLSPTALRYLRSPGSSGSGLLVFDEGGSPMTHSAVNRTVRQACIAAGLEPVTLADIRRLGASMAGSGGHLPPSRSTLVADYVMEFPAHLDPDTDGPSYAIWSALAEHTNLVRRPG